MKKLAILFFAFCFTSCSVFSSLNSNTSIPPKEKFVLGDNSHGKFKTHLRNEGETALHIYLAPNEGGTHTHVELQPKESTSVTTPKNTALIIENLGEKTASVTLKVKGDLNLGMTYQ